MDTMKIEGKSCSVCSQLTKGRLCVRKSQLSTCHVRSIAMSSPEACYEQSCVYVVGLQAFSKRLPKMYS